MTISSLLYGDIEYIPGKSVISVSVCPFITPLFLSTVTPGKLPTCWLEPVSLLNNVVFPQFWFPARANSSTCPLGSGCSSAFIWYLPPSPSPGCGMALCFLGMFFSISVSRILFISILSASATLSVSSYPCIFNSRGSPIGANLTIVTSAPGISPISRKCCLNAPSPPVDIISAVLPISSSFSVILISLSGLK